MEIIISCVIGGGIWLLLTSHLSTLTWTLVGFISVFIMIGIVIWRVFFVPEAEPEPQPQVLTPIPKAALESKKP